MEVDGLRPVTCHTASKLVRRGTRRESERIDGQYDNMNDDGPIGI